MVHEWYMPFRYSTLLVKSELHFDALSARAHLNLNPLNYLRNERSIFQ